MYTTTMYICTLLLCIYVHYYYVYMYTTVVDVDESALRCPSHDLHARREEGFISAKRQRALACWHCTFHLFHPLMP
jgi:hypothetical protein